MAARPLTWLCAVLLAAGTARAQSLVENWEPAGATTMALTGRVTFTADRITFANKASLPLEPAAEIGNFRVDGQPVNALLFKVTTPANPVLPGGGRLCAPGEAVRLLVVWRPAPIGDFATAQARSFAAFSRDAVPESSRDRGSCGTFDYEVQQPRGRR
ncbi:hypothetical protein [Roseicella aquatilis]|uniref:Copper chaperone PCu(A)C n=1 Tax=Roseicella aquatilis TaxID=2527868 RepID=A0A4R4D4K5_9PROT|nr:hypothetical protein [Roseicella aquatilis]TCZ54996.1 hypothetical protein EXY23_22600 [Roseicella aquatilis]